MKGTHKRCPYKTARMADIPPNQTIYVQNLYEKLPKEGEVPLVALSGHGTGCKLVSNPAIVSCRTAGSTCTQIHFIRNLLYAVSFAELRKALYAMFSQFGKIIDVVALKTLRMRGQAWIVFSDVAAATNAKNTMQGFPFFDKPIVSRDLLHLPAAVTSTNLLKTLLCISYEL